MSHVALEPLDKAITIEGRLDQGIVFAIKGRNYLAIDELGLLFVSQVAHARDDHHLGARQRIGKNCSLFDGKPGIFLTPDHEHRVLRKGAPHNIRSSPMGLVAVFWRHQTKTSECTQ